MYTKKYETSFIVEAGIMIAIATVLSYVKVFNMPQGGSVTAGSMIPILLIGIRYGVKKGITVGVLYGILQAILQGYVIHPVQFLFDYPIAFGMLGLSGLFLSQIKNPSTTQGKRFIYISSGVFIAILGRFMSHVISGSIFFKEYAGAQNPWIYSIIYNSTYLIAEFIISTVVIYFLWKPLETILIRK